MSDSTSDNSSPVDLYGAPAADQGLGIGGKSAHPNPNRGAVMHCPYCGGENLWPDVETGYAWNCRECCRVFTVKLHGHKPRNVDVSYSDSRAEDSVDTRSTDERRSYQSNRPGKESGR